MHGRATSSCARMPTPDDSPSLLLVWGSQPTTTRPTTSGTTRSSELWSSSWSRHGPTDIFAAAEGVRGRRTRPVGLRSNLSAPVETRLSACTGKPPTVRLFRARGARFADQATYAEKLSKNPWLGVWDAAPRTSRISAFRSCGCGGNHGAALGGSSQIVTGDQRVCVVTPKRGRSRRALGIQPHRRQCWRYPRWRGAIAARRYRTLCTL
jgi:hypothetical protein